MTERVYLYLNDILPDVEPSYNQDYRQGMTYRQCELEVISPALMAADYELEGPWYTGDGDSFGPLTRCIDTDKGTVVYG